MQVVDETMREGALAPQGKRGVGAVVGGIIMEWVRHGLESDCPSSDLDSTTY